MFECELCHKKFNHRPNLRRHSRFVHKIDLPDLRPESLKCACSKTFSSVPDFTHHLEAEHEVTATFEHRHFDTQADFETWRRSVECSSPVKFSKIRSKKCKDGQTINYHCNRSGAFRSRVNPDQRKREMKTQGSCKINAYCPARITATISNDGGVDVGFCLTHFGHKLLAAHVPLSSPVKNTIATKIAAQVPFHCILSDVRKSLCGEISRAHLLNNQDLKNIMRDFQLDCDYKLNADDAMSVEQWVEKEKFQDGESAVIVYKPKGVVSTEYSSLRSNDFLLGIMTPGQAEVLTKYGGNIICMDSTHGLTGYGYEMTTVLVIDEFGEGFPCAFFISDRNDHTGIEIFLQNIKQRVGAISAKTFLSDMAENFYNAWTSTMGPCDRRLFCTWHVLRAWHKKISTLKQEKREAVSKRVYMLLTETDVNAFLRMLPSTIEMFCNDPETLAFGEYFNKYYAGHSEKWAYCYRLDAGINTNMALERLHGTLKHIFLKGTAAKRMDKTINAMMRLVNEKMYNTLIPLQKGKLSRKIRELRKRHKVAMKLDIDRVVPHENPQIGSWLVFSATKADYYVVTLSAESCECPIRCPHCNACYHKFTCTCIDYSVRGTMCKHVHLLCRFLGTPCDQRGGEKDTSDSETRENLIFNELEPQFDLDLQLEIDTEEKEEESRKIVELRCKPTFIKPFADERKNLEDMFSATLQQCSSKVQFDAVKENLRTLRVKVAALEKGTIPETFECKEKIDIRRIEAGAPSIKEEPSESVNGDKEEMENSIQSYACGSQQELIEPDEPEHTHMNGKTTVPLGKKPHACDQCEFRSARLSRLNVHKKIHSGKKPHACDQCEFKSAHLPSLKAHKRAHAGEKSYACDECEYKSSYKSDLKLHKRTHTGSRPFTCNVCEYSASWVSALTLHKRTHTGEKPYACDECDYRTAKSYDVILHKRKHSGEKPYACNECEFRTKSASTLRRHERSHTGEKRYACSECDYRASQASSLRNHVKTHTGEKPHVCDECDYTATMAFHLRRHKKRAHTDVKPATDELVTTTVSSSLKDEAHDSGGAQEAEYLQLIEVSEIKIEPYFRSSQQSTPENMPLQMGTSEDPIKLEPIKNEPI